MVPPYLSIEELESTFRRPGIRPIFCLLRKPSFRTIEMQLQCFWSHRIHPTCFYKEAGPVKENKRHKMKIARRVTIYGANRL
jgi:hypothetical protein